MSHPALNQNISRPSSVKKNSGFSLLELMTVVSIIAILVGIGAPQLGSWIQNNKLDSAAQQTIGLLRHARTEAIARNQITKVEIRDNQRFWSCEVSNLSDQCNNNTADDRFLMTVEWNPASTLIDSNQPASSVIAFDAKGRRMPRNGLVYISVCDQRGSEFGKIIEINLVGRATLNDIDVGDGEQCL